MARDRTESFLRMISETGQPQTVIEAMRLFGYINEIQYSELNTAWIKMTAPVSFRTDGAETIELARHPKVGMAAELDWAEAEKILPSLY
jgi:hypothetical protein